MSKGSKYAVAGIVAACLAMPLLVLAPSSVRASDVPDYTPPTREYEPPPRPRAVYYPRAPRAYYPRRGYRY